MNLIFRADQCDLKRHYHFILHIFYRSFRNLRTGGQFCHRMGDAGDRPDSGSRRKGFSYRPSLSLRNEGMKKVLKLMVPVLVSTWVQPIVLMINSRYASGLHGGGGVSAIDYGTNLYLTIAGVFVLSVTNVIFPKMSQQSARDDIAGLTETVRSTTTHLYFLSYR